jgi:hypothetical protein
VKDFSACHKEQLVCRLEQGYHVSFSSRILLSFGQNFCPDGVLKFVEKFWFFTIGHLSTLLHGLSVVRMKKYIPVPFKKAKFFNIMLALFV